MKKSSDKHEGDLSVTEDLEFHGLVSGNLVVSPGVSLLLHGYVAGDVIVERTGRATIHGTVIGSVINNGGPVEIFGTVGRIEDRSEIETHVDANAVITRR